MAHMVPRMFKRPVSLAKWSGEENPIDLCNSFTYKRKSKGPRTDPCGTPELTLSGSDQIPSIEKYSILFVRKDLNHSLTVPVIP